MKTKERRELAKQRFFREVECKYEKKLPSLGKAMIKASPLKRDTVFQQLTGLWKRICEEEGLRFYGKFPNWVVYWGKSRGL